MRPGFFRILHLSLSASSAGSIR